MERGELIEEVLRAFFDADADFIKFSKRMSTTDKAAVDKALGLSRRPGGVSDTLIDQA
ncbi:hypothetical protein [Paraburkholderia sp. RL17-337-BIB-A]|uniref:hypothetical protein n=1 Tax=Paraburkholderia sp. RL17-337-BIB-A TaxID=3031636 RepID=UPI0038B84322